MKRFVMIALVVVTVIGAAGYAWKKRPAPPTLAASTPAVQIIDLLRSDVAAIGPTSLARTVPITGSLKPLQQTVVKTKVAGELKQLAVREGQTVTKGQKIGVLDQQEFNVRLDERQAQLQSAQAQMANARQTLENNRQLLAKNFISQAAFDASRFSFDAAQANAAAAQAQLALAQKAVGDTALISPIAGTVAERFAQPGEKLPVDARVLSIVDLSVMEIEAAVPATELAAIAPGQIVKLNVEGLSASYNGVVNRIAPTTMPGTRSVAVYIRLQEQAGARPMLRSGLFTQGVLKVQSLDNVLAVPVGALRDSLGRSTVLVIEKDVLKEREVKTGARGADAQGQGFVVIEQGLTAGEQVVMNAMGQVKLGAQVRLR
jgi:membrane fusion protein, multidrug efflux system